MPQLDNLISDLERARAVEKAAAMDVCDRADDHRLTKSRLAKAEQAHEAAKAESERIRRKIDFVIDAQSDSDLDAPTGYSPSVPCENITQFIEYR